MKMLSADACKLLLLVYFTSLALGFIAGPSMYRNKYKLSRYIVARQYLEFEPILYNGQKLRAAEHQGHTNEHPSWIPSSAPETTATSILTTDATDTFPSTPESTTASTTVTTSSTTDTSSATAVTTTTTTATTTTTTVTTTTTTTTSRTTKKPTTTRLLTTKYLKPNHLCNRKHFHVINRKTSWFEAEKLCSRIAPNGKLVSIRSQQDQNCIKAYFNSHKPDTSACQKDFWTSGRFRGNGFVWAAENSKFSFKNWRRNEPNRLAGEDCVHIWGYEDYKWNDINCDGRRYRSCPLCVL